MSMSDEEIENTRFHLGYGNLDFGAYPYTADGFKSLFEQVVAPNLTVGDETTATTAVAAGSTTAVTPVSMTGIGLHTRLVVDVGDAVETVVVRSVTVSSFTATFRFAHAASGYPVCVQSGHTRLRLLLAQADKAWEAILSPDLGAAAGIKQVDKGDVVWFEGFPILRDRTSHYKAIVRQISLLTRVPPQWESEGGGGGNAALEVY